MNDAHPRDVGQIGDQLSQLVFGDGAHRPAQPGLQLVPTETAGDEVLGQRLAGRRTLGITCTLNDPVMIIAACRGRTDRSRISWGSKSWVVDSVMESTVGRRTGRHIRPESHVEDLRWARSRASGDHASPAKTE